MNVGVWKHAYIDLRFGGNRTSRSRGAGCRDDVPSCPLIAKRLEDVDFISHFEVDEMSLERCL